MVLWTPFLLACSPQSLVDPGYQRANVPAELCANGRDDDGDGDIDCADSECAAACVERCDDGGDNDQDGLTDCQDPQCAATLYCDADGDGFVAEVRGGDDCDDASAGVYPGAQDVCGDGVDQDCSGADASCGNDSGGSGAASGSAGGGSSATQTATDTNPTTSGSGPA